MSDNRTTELLPCPFCGDEASVIGDSESGYAAYCPECIDGGHTEVGWYGTKADAIEAWNTRYNPIDDARIVEVETSHIDIEQGEIITRFVPEQAATEQVEELKMRLALAAADSMGGVAFAALAVDELEQAIAATLGNEREKALEKLARSLYVDYRNEWPDRAEEAYAERMRELGLG